MPKKNRQNKTSTNITEEHKKVFDMIQTRAAPFVLMSCFVNGQPSCAISLIAGEDDGAHKIYPFFVALTKDMKLTDHDDVAPQAG